MTQAMHIAIRVATSPSSASGQPREARRASIRVPSLRKSKRSSYPVHRAVTSGAKRTRVAHSATNRSMQFVLPSGLNATLPAQGKAGSGNALGMEFTALLLRSEKSTIRGNYTNAPNHSLESLASCCVESICFYERVLCVYASGFRQRCLSSCSVGVKKRAS
jgi:hypothetical protein